MKKKDPNDQPHPHIKALCKPYDQNQITPGFNDIRIYGGHMSLDGLQNDVESLKDIFDVTYAYILDGSIDLSKTEAWATKYDIGMLITDINLFDKEKLKETDPNARPPMLPICLSAKGTNFNDEKIMGVGWGLIYEESPRNDPTKDPYYSSCMTNELGPTKWIFEHCDMQFIKNNNWACEKKKYPDAIKNDRALCKRLFDKARKIYGQTQIEIMDYVDKIHIYLQDDPDTPIKNDRNPDLICYNEKHFQEIGWCKVHGYAAHSEAWGFCSPSCDEKLIKVFI